MSRPAPVNAQNRVALRVRVVGAEPPLVVHILRAEALKELVVVSAGDRDVPCCCGGASHRDAIMTGGLSHNVSGCVLKAEERVAR